MKTIHLFRKITLCMLLIPASVVMAQDACDSGCGGSTESPSYQVVSPVGSQTVEMITMAPRLSTLEGKTIALVGGSFMASVTHLELKKLILSRYPTAKVYLLDEIGSAGLYPAPGVRRRSVEEFQQRLKDYGVDAVISGNGGCGICTPKETGSCIAAEYLQIPSVMIAAPGFDEQAITTALNNGVPALRVAVYPGAFATHTNEQLIENTRNVLWQQVVDALTTEITAEEIESNSRLEGADARTVVYNGSADEINQFFCEMSWSDGLPVVPPTTDRVNEFLNYTDYAWNDEIAVLSPAYRQTLAWHVAVNGVMAGCKPEYMPILIALTKAMASPLFRRTLGSTHAWMPYCWLNGPLSRQLGFDNGQGQINMQPNIAVGRFMTLAMRNLMGYYVKQNRMGTFGYLASWCMAEDEDACRRIGWNPYHARQGFDVNASTVTATSALLWGNNMAPATTDGEKIMQLMAWDITERGQLALGSGMQFTFRTILMTEEVAARLRQTYVTLRNLENELIATARRPLSQRAFANYYANPGSALQPDKVTLQQYTRRIAETEDAAMTATPVWCASDATEMLTIPVMQKGETAFLITGDPSRNKIQTMPGGGISTTEIELPSDWDTLMERLGYPPLSSFRLPDSSTPSATLRPSADTDDTVVRTDYFSASGQRIRKDSPRFRIRRTVYSSGKVKAQKSCTE